MKKNKRKKSTQKIQNKNRTIYCKKKHVNILIKFKIIKNNEIKLQEKKI